MHANTSTITLSLLRSLFFPWGVFIFGTWCSLTAFTHCHHDIKDERGTHKHTLKHTRWKGRHALVHEGILSVSNIDIYRQSTGPQDMSAVLLQTGLRTDTMKYNTIQNDLSKKHSALPQPLPYNVTLLIAKHHLMYNKIHCIMHIPHPFSLECIQAASVRGLLAMTAWYHVIVSVITCQVILWPVLDMT